MFWSQTASTFGSDIDFLFWLITGIVGFWFILAEVALFYFIFKFRRAKNPKAQYIAGETKAQKRWITVPHALVILCDIVLIAGTVLVWNKVKIDQPEADEIIRVITQQWAWTFVHAGPDGELDTSDDITTVDEMHITTNRVYHFELTSKDVVHNFSVPAFRLKQDAVPGRMIRGWFNATRTGKFDIQCAEICGIGHGLMGAMLYIESDAEHSSWLNSHSPATASVVAETVADDPLQRSESASLSVSGSTSKSGEDLRQTALKID